MMSPKRAMIHESGTVRLAFLGIGSLVGTAGGWYLRCIPASMLKRFIPLAFVLLWIVPVAWVGLMRSNYPLYPDWIAPLFRVSGVFENPPSRWRIFFIEVQDRTKGNWHDVDENLLFAPTPLGERTRFQQLMNELERAKSPGQLSRLLDWIANHLSQTGDSLSQVRAIRIVHFGVPPETFLKSPSLIDVYKTATAMNLPFVIVANLNVISSPHEHP